MTYDSEGLERLEAAQDELAADQVAIEVVRGHIVYNQPPEVEEETIRRLASRYLGGLAVSIPDYRLGVDPLADERMGKVLGRLVKLQGESTRKPSSITNSDDHRRRHRA